jgi:PAS domain S-box-containing protein
LRHDSARQPSFVLLPQQYVQVAIDNVEDAIVLLVPGNNTLRIRYANRSFERIFGYTNEEILGAHVGLLARQPEERDGLLRLEFDVTRPHRSEAILKTKDGNDVLVEIDIQSVELEGGTAGLMVMRDVTEYRRLEHIAAASEVSESVGYVFAGIRHELGNPLNSLKAALTLLADPVVELPDDQRRDYLVRAIGEVLRMEQLLTQLRTFNTHESVQLGRIDVRPFFERFVRLALSDCNARDTSISFEATSDDSITADGRILHQIFLLLLSNALDAVARSPKRSIVLACSHTLRATRLTLSDSGPGMTDEQTMNAQRPFVTSKPNGTGLGLALARRYASLTKCTLEISSKVGIGTTCSLVFDRINPSEG